MGDEVKVEEEYKYLDVTLNNTPLDTTVKPSIRRDRADCTSNGSLGPLVFAASWTTHFKLIKYFSLVLN